jgi:hypothetical protein
MVVTERLSPMVSDTIQMFLLVPEFTVPHPSHPNLLSTWQLKPQDFFVGSKKFHWVLIKG